MRWRAAVERWLRRRILARARGQSVSAALARAAADALRAARWAAECSPAYRALLTAEGVDPASPRSFDRLSDLPVLTKENTFGRFTLDALARAVPTTDLADVLTSSGRSGRSFGFRLTDRNSHERSWFGIDLGLEDAFRVDTLPTLLINCLPMGVVFRSRAVTVANVSVRADMACAIARDVGPRYAQTIICTDPVFMRVLLDEADAVGVDWRALNASAILGEEVLVENQRSYFAARMGIDPDTSAHRVLASSFGVGELGLNLLFESRDTIRIRRAARSHAGLLKLLVGDDHPEHAAGSSDVPLVFCYSPYRVHIEVLNPDRCGFGELCFTLLGESAVIPLPRFATGDIGRLLEPGIGTEAARLAGVTPPWLPMVLLAGRKSDRMQGWPSVEAIKSWLYADARIADGCTGVFRLEPGVGGRGRLTLQAASTSEAANAELQSRVRAAAAALQSTPEIDVYVVQPEAFPDRPLADYERKPIYMAR